MENGLKSHLKIQDHCWLKLKAFCTPVATPVPQEIHQHDTKDNLSLYTLVTGSGLSIGSIRKNTSLYHGYQSFKENQVRKHTTRNIRTLFYWCNKRIIIESLATANIHNIILNLKTWWEYKGLSLETIAAFLPVEVAWVWAIWPAHFQEYSPHNSFPPISLSKAGHFLSQCLLS